MKHVTILGRAERYSPIPPGEAWGVNSLPRTREEDDRITRQFQMHPFHTLSREERVSLACLRVPTYVIRPTATYPHAIPYPLHAVPSGPFASSFDYMLALALWEGFDSILLTGIGYAGVGTLRERLCEHVSLAYWIGLARGKGRHVTIAPGSRLLWFPYRYGYDYHRERRWGQAQALSALHCQALDDGHAHTPTHPIRGIIPSGKRPHTKTRKARG